MYLEHTTTPLLAEAFERIKTETNLQRGHAANLKGRLAEERALAAAFIACEKESWLYVARAATRTEDADGIDIVVYSEVGKLFLQVKSSHYGARRFRYKRPSAKVMVVIIEPEMSAEKVMNKVHVALCRLHQYFMKMRRRDK